MSTTLTTSEIRAILVRQEHPLRQRLYQIDVRTTHWLARHSLTLLRVAAGLVFVWLGALNTSVYSPAEPLMQTLFPSFANVALRVLAIWQLAIGVGFLIAPLTRLLIGLLSLHLLAALVVLLVCSDVFFKSFPIVLTIEGQVVLLNGVIALAGLVVAATARGGGLTAEPDALQRARDIERKREL